MLVIWIARTVVREVYFCRVSVIATSPVHRRSSDMDQEDYSGIEELETWLCTLQPRSELVARMAIRSCLPGLGCSGRYDRRCFARITTLINELGLVGGDLNDVRMDVREVEARIREGLGARKGFLVPHSMS